MALSDKDLQLKLEVAAIFRRMGYVTFTEVDLSAYCYQIKYTRKNVTDFDILGVFIEPDLEVWTAITECKSATGQAMQSLLKLNGVKEFFGAQKAYFVQQNILDTLSGFARSLLCRNTEVWTSLYVASHHNVFNKKVW